MSTLRVTRWSASDPSALEMQLASFERDVREQLSQLGDFVVRTVDEVATFPLRVAMDNRSPIRTPSAVVCSQAIDRSTDTPATVTGFAWHWDGAVVIDAISGPTAGGEHTFTFIAFYGGT